MRKVTRIDVVHFARFQAVLFALVGFLSGILYSFGGAIYDLYSSGTVNSGTGLAFLALIGMPIIFSAFGFILGLVEAYLFNLTAKWIGGINLDFLPEC